MRGRFVVRPRRVVCGRVRVGSNGKAQWMVGGRMRAVGGTLVGSRRTSSMRRTGQLHGDFSPAARAAWCFSPRWIAYTRGRATGMGRTRALLEALGAAWETHKAVTAWFVTGRVPALGVMCNEFTNTLLGGFHPGGGRRSVARGRQPPRQRRRQGRQLRDCAPSTELRYASPVELPCSPLTAQPAPSCAPTSRTPRTGGACCWSP